MKPFYSLSRGLFLCLALLALPACPLIDELNPPIDEKEVGEVLWEHEVPDVDKYLVLNSLAFDDNTIYYAQGGGTLYWTAARINAVDAETGSLKWSSEVIDHMDISSEIVIGDSGVIYVIGLYTLYALDRNTGAFLWTWEVPVTLPNPEGPGEVYTYGQIGSLAVANDGSLLVGSIGSGVYHRGIYSIDKSGQKRWHNLNANNGGAYSMVINKDDIAFYYSNFNGNEALFALDIASGSIVWTKEIAYRSSSHNNILITPDNTLICAVSLNGDSRKLHEIDCTTGNVLWSSTDEVSQNTKILNESGQVLIDEGDGIYSLTPGGSGTKVKLTDPHFMEGAMIDSKNRLALVHNINWETNLVCYDMNGAQMANITYPGVDHRLFLLLPENKLVVRANNTIAAIQADAFLNQNGWPSRTHDLRNSSNVNR